MADLTSSLQKLAAYRPQTGPKSLQVYKEGISLLENNSFANLGDEGWDVLEKLALAAIDQNDIVIADRCLQLLSDRFPGSPRVECLTGIRMEVTERPEFALQYYDKLLEVDSSNAAAWMRKAAVLRKMGNIDAATQELSAMLDTFYTDVSGWLELADIYASCKQYTYALQSLSHALLLAPQNPFLFLHFAETAYLAGDIPLSLKSYLTVVDMTDDDDDVPVSDSIPSTITLRAWYGVKLCTRKLISEPRTGVTSLSQTSTPSTFKLSSLDDLSEERLRTAYLHVKRQSPPSIENDFMAELATMIQ